MCENLSVWGLNLDVIDSPSCRWSFMFLQEFVQSDIISDSHSEIVQLFHHQHQYSTISILGQYNKADNTSVQAIFTTRTNVPSHTLYLCSPCRFFFY